MFGRRQARGTHCHAEKKPGKFCQNKRVENRAFCRKHLAHYKVPRSVVYGPVPKSVTGKVRKNLLREQARELALLL